MYISAHPSLHPAYFLRPEHHDAWIDTQSILYRQNYHWARDALWHLGLFFALRHETVLLPSYLCHSVLDPFKAAGTAYKFYQVTRKLEIDIDDVQQRIAQGAHALLVIHYNGMLQQHMRELVKICQQQHVVLIEDCSECLLSRGPDGPAGIRGQASISISIYNYRKWLPLPDGATLVIRDARLLTLPEVKKQQHHRLDSISTADLLLRFIRHTYATKDQWLSSYLHHLTKTYGTSVRSNYAYGSSPISLLSQILLRRILPSEVIFLRRRNYRWLQERLTNLPGVTLLGAEGEGIVPRGVALLVEQRNALQARLARQGIETSVRWHLPAEVPSSLYPDAHWIAENILVLPCHQDLRENELETLFTAFVSALPGR